MRLTLAPLGGLANRMRAILSASALAKHAALPLRIVWMRDKGLNARFDELFEPTSFFQVEEIPGWKNIAFLPPCKRNLFIPRLLQMGYEQTFFDPQLAELQHTPERLLELAKGRNILISSGLGFYPADSSLYSSCFLPKQDILDAASRRLAELSPDVVGVHIRRTDNAVSISKSPVEAFVERMRQLNPSQFYLATDSEEVKRQLNQLFPGRIVCSSQPASRQTLQGMRDAVAEMFILSRTSYFLGSYYSSFSDIILEMNGKGEIVLA